MRPFALITGASSGIGRELAKLFAEDRYDLIVVARRKERLESLARDLTAAFGVSVRVITKDLSDSKAPIEIFEEISRLGIEIDALVNNAGLGVYGPFAETDLARELAILQVNVVALTYLTKLFLPRMIERGSGRILNLASTAAFQPGPLMAVYYATKAYVLSFTEAIADEVAGSGVTVTALSPGPTETEFQKRAGVEGTLLSRGALVMDAGSAARAGYEGMKRGKRIVIPGLGNKILAQSVRFAPRRLLTAVARRIQEKRSGVG